MSVSKKNTGKVLKVIDPIECVWGLICRMSSVDQRTNNISLFNIIEQFNLPADYFIKQKEAKQPLLFPGPYEVILHWRRKLDIKISNEEISADLKVSTISPDGITLMEMNSPIKLPMGKKNLRFNMEWPGLRANVPGDYIKRVEVKFSADKEFRFVCEIPFTVVMV